ncbi:MAG: anaerobic ribonucleoside-triphosphate reductase activating protein [Alistipes sp.]|jgi:anaerobic ribonucleoside-triphosphate reductase activating protein|nr:anaerobic ribonucleoside-triphosphate reductase activating protein [Alistipes sp.]
MLLVASYDIVFQEIPGEVTLALNLSACSNACPGCHSAYLQAVVGEPLGEDMLGRLLDRYGRAVSCVAFMGGDGDPGEVNRLARLVRSSGEHGGLKTAWYSGRAEKAPEVDLKNLNYIKLGPYVERFGGLDSPTTNQRFYRVEPDETLTDMTSHFVKKSLL